MKRIKIKKLNNDGAALLMAIVAVVFITILTTLLLYVSVMNYEMKTTDYRTTLSFYGAEVPLEELRMQLAVVASEAAEEAYKHVMYNYGILDNEDMRYTQFQKIFFEEVEKKWALKTSFTGDWVAAVKKALNDNPAYDVFMGSGPTSGYAYHVQLGAPDPTTGAGGIRFDKEESDGRIILKEITVVYTENNFVSQISTDFCITVPELNWSVNEYVDAASLATPEDALRETINFEDCVSYMNWTKQ